MHALNKQTFLNTYYVLGTVLSGLWGCTAAKTIDAGTPGE